MNMGSLKAELMFPPKYTAGAGGGNTDASDGELDEDTMILGTTPQVSAGQLQPCMALDLFSIV